MTAPRLRVAAITLDFGNTLVRVGHAGLRSVVEDTADAMVARGIAPDRDAFVSVWAEERERQFREDVPEFREPDIPRRAIRVLARGRGLVPPPADGRWDDAAAARRVESTEVDALIDVYSRAFIDRISPVEDATATLERLSGRGFALAILSNWPLAVAIDRYVDAHGWRPFLRAVVVSERVGTIKPHPAFFRAAAAALGVAGGRPSILHVGDDWAADVAGASRAGWRSAYLRDRQAGSPLPASEPGAGVAAGEEAIAPDLEIDELSELDALVELDESVGRDRRAAAAPT
ncbi:MAG TPA: HAD family hydrolase [Candidatus Limnocylindria bacterium]|nr:HAD family hydrolase [Candidatus Limnocylindria bacterium]